MNTQDEIEVGTQVTTPHGPGIVQWIEGPLITVRIYSDPIFAPPRVLDFEHVAFWPPRKENADEH